MGKFTEKLVGGNSGKAAKAIPIGAIHYEMGGVSFYLNQKPKDVLSAIVTNHVQMLQNAGEFEAAKAMIDNPQPFLDQPIACAVFMAAAMEVQALHSRIAALENVVISLATAIEQNEGGSSEWFRQVIEAAAHDALNAIGEKEETDAGR